LILNNRDFWLPYLVDCAEAIRRKLQELPNEGYRLFFPPADDNNGFCVFAFIDNTMMAMCRPGGGPQREGEQAPRLPKEIQQAWWTGWKKLHGLKWQTVDLPNGMNFEVWGPASVRRNDNFTLHRSKIEEKLEQLQLPNLLKFKLFGDSAYSDSDYIVTGGGRGLSSVRETIEWDYKDLKTYWKYLDYKHALQLRRQPLGKIMLVCLLLRNAMNTMIPNQTAQYFNCIPPSFDEWTAQGPRAKPIPEDCIFNLNFNYYNDNNNEVNIQDNNSDSD
jgi:hypothetical protein